MHHVLTLKGVHLTTFNPQDVREPTEKGKYRSPSEHLFCAQIKKD